MGMIYKRGEVFWIKYYSGGKPIRESTDTKKQKEAERFLKDREGRVAIGAPAFPRPCLWRAYSQPLAPFQKALHDQDEPDHVQYEPHYVECHDHRAPSPRWHDKLVPVAGHWFPVLGIGHKPRDSSYLSCFT